MKEQVLGTFRSTPEIRSNARRSSSASASSLPRRRFTRYVMRTLEQSVRQQLKAWGTGVQGVQQGRVIAGQGKSDPLYNR